MFSPLFLNPTPLPLSFQSRPSLSPSHPTQLIVCASPVSRSVSDLPSDPIAAPSLAHSLQEDISKGALRKALLRLENALPHHTSPQSPLVSYHHLHSLLYEATRNNQWDIALRTFNILEQTGLYSRRPTSALLLNTLCRTGRITECHQVLTQLWTENLQLYDQSQKQLSPRDIQRRRPDEKMVTQVANAAVNKGRADVAVQVVNDMEKNGTHMTIFTVSVLIKAYGRLSDANGVTKVLAMLSRRDLTPDLVVYNGAIDAYVRSGEKGMASAVLREILRRGLSPNAKSYNPLMRGLSRSGNIDDILKLKLEMEKRAIRPTGYTYNAMIRAFTKNDMFDNAVELLDEMEKGVVGKDLGVAYTIVIGALAEKGRLKDSMILLERCIKNMDTDGEFQTEIGVAVSAVLTGLLNKGEVVNAWKVFRGVWAMWKLKLPVDCYCAMIRGLSKRGDRVALQAAGRVLEEMKGVFGKKSIKNGVLKRGKEGDGHGGCEMKDLVLAYNMMIDGFVRIGDTTSGERLLDEMEGLGYVASSVTYTTLMNGYGKELDVLATKRMFQRMRNAGIKPDRVALNAFIGACVRGGDMKLGMRLFEEMVKHGGHMSPNLVTFSAMIAGLVREERTDEAWDMYEEMKGVGIVPNERLLERMMASFVSVDIKPNRDRALELEGMDMDFELQRLEGMEEEEREDEEEETDVECDGDMLDEDLFDLLLENESWGSKRAKILLEDMDKCKCSAVNKARWRQAIRSVYT